MKKETLITKAGRNPAKHAGAVNPPIYQTSTVIFPTWEAYEEAERGKHFYEETEGTNTPDLSYAISGTPTTFALERALAELEGEGGAVIVPSGLSAIAVAIQSFVASGDHILVTDSVYGPGRRFCNKELKRFGVEVEFYDPLIGGEIKKLIKPNTKLVFLESPGSMTFEVQDIPAITQAVKSVREEIVTVMDNSWATSLFFQPYKYGVDVSLQAITKYIAGHSDIIMGVVFARGSEHLKKIAATFRNTGLHVHPQACYQALRGLRTMATRLKAHQAAALQIAKWLEKHPKVSEVIYPALKGAAGHEIWQRDFSGASSLFAFILDKKYERESISRMLNNMEIFGIGCSWGGYESLIIHFDPSVIRTATRWQKPGSAIRIYIGLEDPDDLILDLEKGLGRL